jgi:hypothetical protein
MNNNGLPLAPIISFIANEEYFLEPSGGGSDILSDLYTLEGMGYKLNLLTINRLGKLRTIQNKKSS